jgi:hypothetical protein
MFLVVLARNLLVRSQTRAALEIHDWLPLQRALPPAETEAATSIRV